VELTCKPEKSKVAKVRVELKTISAVTYNHNTMRPTPFEWQTDPFVWIASGQAYL